MHEGVVALDTERGRLTLHSEELALVPKGVVDIWLSYQEIKTLLVRVQSEQAKSAAEKIGQFDWERRRLHAVLPGLALVLLVIAASAPSLANGFAYVAGDPVNFWARCRVCA